jgi:hypothetical protein
MPDPSEYRIVVMKDKVSLFMRTLRIWPAELQATEHKGMQIGMELARDAIHHAGLWDSFETQRKKPT